MITKIICMKKLLFTIAAAILSAGLFAQAPSDSVFSESEVVLKTPSGDISGTLTIPNTAKSSPIVLIIAGSGPTDRDCNSAMGIRTNAYKLLAADLVKNGISSLRFDKRGIGKSRQTKLL